MRLMVYARYGRAGIYMMQEYCRLLEIEASAADLRTLRAALEALPADHPISGLLRRSKDFWRPEAMADALLHPQDRAYAVPEIYAWLDRCGMSFGRWIEQAPYLAECGMVARSPHASRLAALPPGCSTPPSSFSVEQWCHTASSPTADDGADENQPITFAGDLGASTSLLRCHGQCAFANVCLQAASRC